MVAYLDGAMKALPDVARALDEESDAPLAVIVASTVNATLFVTMMDVICHHECDDPKEFAERTLLLATTALVGYAEGAMGEADDAG